MPTSSAMAAKPSGAGKDAGTFLRRRRTKSELQENLACEHDPAGADEPVALVEWDRAALCGTHRAQRPKPTRESRAKRFT